MSRCNKKECKGVCHGPETLSNLPKALQLVRTAATQFHVDCTLVFKWDKGFSILAFENQRNPDNLKQFKSRCVSLSKQLKQLLEYKTQSELYKQIIEAKYIRKIKIAISSSYKGSSLLYKAVQLDAPDNILEALVECGLTSTTETLLLHIIRELLKRHRYKILRMVLVYNSLENNFCVFMDNKLNKRRGQYYWFNTTWHSPNSEKRDS